MAKAVPNFFCPKYPVMPYIGNKGHFSMVRIAGISTRNLSIQSLSVTRRNHTISLAMKNMKGGANIFHVQVVANIVFHRPFRNRNT